MTPKAAAREIFAVGWLAAQSRALHAFMQKVSPQVRHRISRSARLTFDVAGVLVDRLPSSDDTPVQRVVKTMSAADAVRGVLFPSTTDPVAQYAARFGLIAHTSAQFVQLFFGSDLHRRFAIGHVRVDAYNSIVEARSDLGHLAFVKGDYSEHPRATFYLSPNAQLRELVEAVWQQYRGRMHIMVKSVPYGDPITEFGTFERDASPLLGAANARLDAVVVRHRLYANAGIQRSYMLYGPPGTGKSRFAAAMVDQLGGCLLQVDATSLARMTVASMQILLDQLRPSVVVMDDVDKADVETALPTVLEVIRRMKGHDGATTILTANTIDGFDRGLLRPGRVDSWLEFKLPDAAERLAVLRGYVDGFGIVGVSPAMLSHIVKASDGLAQDYLRELALALRWEDVREVCARARQMRKILGDEAAPSDSKAKAPALAKGPASKAR